MENQIFNIVLIRGKKSNNGLKVFNESIWKLDFQNISNIEYKYKYLFEIKSWKYFKIIIIFWNMKFWCLLIISQESTQKDWYKYTLLNKIV